MCKNATILKLGVTHRNQAFIGDFERVEGGVEELAREQLLSVEMRFAGIDDFSDERLLPTQLRIRAREGL